MSDTQAIFAIFFAIFWGAIFNVQGRWLAFQPVLRYGRVLRRWLLSVALLNLAPVLAFVWAFYRLRGGPDLSGLGGKTLMWELSAAVFSCFWTMGFYRLWQSIIQAAPSWFYWRESEQPPDLVGSDPTIEKLALGHKLGGWNLLSAVFYFALAGFAPCLRPLNVCQL